MRVEIPEEVRQVLERFMSESRWAEADDPMSSNAATVERVRGWRRAVVRFLEG